MKSEMVSCFHCFGSTVQSCNVVPIHSQIEAGVCPLSNLYVTKTFATLHISVSLILYVSSNGLKSYLFWFHIRPCFDPSFRL